MGKGIPKKKYSKISKKDCETIITESIENEMYSINEIVKLTNCSPGMANKFRFYLKNLELKQFNLESDEKPDLPKGYVISSNYKEVINSVLYKLGYVVIEKGNDG